MKRIGGRNLINSQSQRLPPNFRSSMSKAVDPRFPLREQGLGVIDGAGAYQGKFYPMAAIPKGGQIEDIWQGRALVVTRSEVDGVPRAHWADDAEDDGPMQLLTRWYGFSFTYPDCEIYDE